MRIKRISRPTLWIAILVTLVVIGLTWRSFNIKSSFNEPYTRYPLGPKNGAGATVRYTSRSSISNQYGIYLYQVTGLVVPGRNKNVMKYAGGGLVGENVSGPSGAFGWMIGVVKPESVKGYRLQIAFDKPVTLFDGEVNGPHVINNINTRKTNDPNGRIYINQNIVRLNFPSNQSQIMISLRYL